GDADPRTLDAVVLKLDRGPFARDDDAADARERLALGLAQARGEEGIEPGLERERMVDEREEAQACSRFRQDATEAREREAVDDRDAAVRQPGEQLAGLPERRRGRPREARVERVHADLPAGAGELLDDPPAVDVA